MADARGENKRQTHNKGKTRAEQLQDPLVTIFQVVISRSPSRIVIQAITTLLAMTLTAPSRRPHLRPKAAVVGASSPGA